MLITTWSTVTFPDTQLMPSTSRSGGAAREGSPGHRPCRCQHQDQAASAYRRCCQTAESALSRRWAIMMGRVPAIVVRGFEIDRQVHACLYWRHGRCVQGPGRSHPTQDPRRTGRSRRPDPLRDLQSADHEARDLVLAAGDLATPRSARGGGSGAHPQGRPLQVPLPRHGAAGPVAQAVAPWEQK